MDAEDVGDKISDCDSQLSLVHVKAQGTLGFHVPI
jgi:hypothetical protein